MSQTISIVITAQDKASKKMREFGAEAKAAGDKAQEAGGKVFKLSDHVGALAGAAATAGLATRSLLGVISQSSDAANKLDGALIGLTSIARAYSVDTKKATRAAQELARDGLMTVTDSATGLKNLLSAGFGLEQSITLMRRFKDSAAFGRQGSLSFGQAVATATEGIKNGNSILVDNAGVTKNLSVMLKEAGLSAQDLGNASSDAAVRQAIFNGIVKETNAQTGDAARLAESAAGKQAQWSAQTEVLQQRIGASLQPALLGLLEVATPVIEKLAGWIEKNPELAAGILIAVTAVTGLIAIAASLGLAIAGLGPVFTLFGATSKLAIAGVTTAFSALKLAVLAPLVMPAIAVAAAIASLVAVKKAADEARSAVDNASRVKEAAHKEDMRMIEVVKGQYQRGEISKEQYSKMLGIIGRNASGTNSWSGGQTLVGEHGPEIVNLPRGTSVTPAFRSKEASTQGGGGHTVIIENYNSYNQRDDQRFFRDIGFTLELAS